MLRRLPIEYMQEMYFTTQPMEDSQPELLEGSRRRRGPRRRTGLMASHGGYQQTRFTRRGREQAARARHPTPGYRQHVERLRDAMTTDGWRQAIRSLFTVYTPDIISAVRCPIAILSGTLDQVAPHRDHAERLLAAAPWAKSFSFEDCGHMLKLEAPVTFNSIVRQMAAEMPGNRWQQLETS
jgi:pimeloyl-ACP methyl ester carboxylesterase